jgi:hypothetical protein
MDDGVFAVQIVVVGERAVVGRVDAAVSRGRAAQRI